MTIETINETNAVPGSNLSNSNELTTSVRDLNAESRAKGHYHEASTFIPDKEFNNNLDVVIRDGSRVHSGGQYRPNDIVMINGTTMEYEMAQSLGLLTGNQFTTPQESRQETSAENSAEPEATDDRPLETRVLQDQFELAFGENSEAVLNTLGQDIVMNGELSEHGINFLHEKMGVSEQRCQETYSEMQEVGGQVLSQYLETGDGLSLDRIEFLVDLAETGTKDQQATVRNIWFKAATGQLSRDQAIEAFDHLWGPYDG